MANRCASLQLFAPLFYVEVSLDDGETALGTAASKRAAEQEAAANLLKRLSVR